MLLELQAHSLRILDTSITFSPRINVIWGPNGSGKSTVLEAIYYLAYGRSFRSARHDPLIAQHADAFLIRVLLSREEQQYHLALERSHHHFQAKLNQNKASLIDLARQLPLVFIDSDSHRQFFNTPAVRRRLFDWLLFHVEPEYLSAMRSYNRALKQRNHALKNQLPLSPWDQSLSRYGEQITMMRQKILGSVQEALSSEMSGLDVGNVSLSYDPGYRFDLGLKQCLSDSRVGDLAAGITRVGPHRGDWLLVSNQMTIASSFSQGQQKSTYFALSMALHQLMDRAGRRAIVLIDDIAAELDENRRTFITESLIKKNCQAILTGILERDIKSFHADKEFHVERGKVINS